MIKSVRIKMFLYFTLFLACFLFLSIVMNIQFFEKYFSYKNERSALRAYEHVNDAFRNKPESIPSILTELRGRYFISTVVDAESMAIKYNTDSKQSRNHIKLIIRELIDPEMDNLKSNYIYETVELTGSATDSPGQRSLDSSRDNIQLLPETYVKELVFIKELDTGDLLILRKPLHVIIQNSQVLNEFMMYVSIVIFLLGSIVVFFFTKKITRPIVELSHIAKSISKLDFSRKFKVKTKDEIGILGESINLISDELHTAMDDLMVVNAELKEDVERKKKIDEMRKNFISSVSHELKSPIGITKGYAEGLKFNIANNEEKKKRYYDILIDEAEKMDKMVKQLLSLSNLESDIFQLEKSIFNITVLVEEVIEKFQPIIKEKNIEMIFTFDEDYFVNADYLKIEQVINNYITNAINHVDERKYIEIRTGLVDDKVRVTVINSGENIPEEDLVHIWESFYKVDKARSREYGGTGLGLSIVKSIMEHHEEMYGALNKEIGVEFWFELNNVNE